MDKALLVVVLFLGLASAQDDFWPPLDEEWRCIDHDKSVDYVMETHNLLTYSEMNPQAGALREQDIDCPIIDPYDPTWCPSEEYFPIKCNCHAYYRCFTLIPGKPLVPCIYKCWPYDLVFDPNTKSCVKEPQAPPGTCYATNVTHSTTPKPTQPTQPTTLPTVPTTKPTVPTTKPTVPTTKPTVPTTRPTTPTTRPTVPTTTGPAGACEYEGQKLPYPGDCHKYYRCMLKPDNSFDVEIFDCGAFVFDPAQGSCVWDDIDNDLCA